MAYFLMCPIGVTTGKYMRSKFCLDVPIESEAKDDLVDTGDVSSTDPEEESPPRTTIITRSTSKTSFYSIDSLLVSIPMVDFSLGGLLEAAAIVLKARGGNDNENKNKVYYHFEFQDDVKRVLDRLALNMKIANEEVCYDLDFCHESASPDTMETDDKYMTCLRRAVRVINDEGQDWGWALSLMCFMPVVSELAGYQLISEFLGAQQAGDITGQLMSALRFVLFDQLNTKVRRACQESLSVLCSSGNVPKKNKSVQASLKNLTLADIQTSLMTGLTVRSIIIMYNNGNHNNETGNNGGRAGETSSTTSAAMDALRNVVSKDMMKIIREFYFDDSSEMSFDNEVVLDLLTAKVGPEYVGEILARVDHLLCPSEGLMSSLLERRIRRGLQSFATSLRSKLEHAWRNLAVATQAFVALGDGGREHLNPKAAEDYYKNVITKRILSREELVTLMGACSEIMGEVGEFQERIKQHLWGVHGIQSCYEFRGGDMFSDKNLDYDIFVHMAGPNKVAKRAEFPLSPEELPLYAPEEMWVTCEYNNTTSTTGTGAEGLKVVRPYRDILADYPGRSMVLTAAVKTVRTLLRGWGY